MSRIKDIKGKVFGKLTVLKFHSIKDHKALWECICECGTKTISRGDHLRNGRSRSCGCLGGCPITHGCHRRGLKSPAYKSWANMMQRCTNPNSDWYHCYGGRGITVCEEWKDFRNFLRDMGERPAGLSLERINNDKGYSPDNCKWATTSEQNANKRPCNTSLGRVPILQYVT